MNYPYFDVIYFMLLFNHVHVHDRGDRQSRVLIQPYAKLIMYKLKDLVIGLS